jgi:hypothetical protein
VIGALLLSSALAADCPDEPVITYEKGTFRAAACIPAECEDTCYLGATLRRGSDAQHLDLAFVEGKAGEPVVVEKAVGTGYLEYIVAIWEHKSEDASHPTGFVLDQELLTVPGGAFGDYRYSFAAFDERAVSILDAGGGALTAKVAGALEALGHHSIPKEVQQGGKAGNTRDDIEVLYRAKWDRAVAWTIAGALSDADVGYRWRVRQWDGAPEAFVIAVGGP